MLRLTKVSAHRGRFLAKGISGGGEGGRSCKGENVITFLKMVSNRREYPGSFLLLVIGKKKNGEEGGTGADWGQL